MKSSTSFPYRTLLALFFLLAFAGAQAQTKSRGSQPGPDSLAARLSKYLSVSREKAGQIQAALNYRQDELIRLMHDSTIAPAQKQQQLKKLLAMRRFKADSVLSPAQKEKLKTLHAAALKKEGQRRTELEQRHQKELNQTPRQQVNNPVKGDTIRNKVKIKTH